MLRVEDAERQTGVFYQESFDRQAGEFGELPDGYTRLVLNFYHQIVAKLPDLASRYKTYKGAIVASTALLSDVSMAVLRRIHDGHNSEQILQEKSLLKKSLRLPSW